jgi:hypothetical protein
MDDRIRASDADRERITARLREHFAAGRLTSEELDERLSAALSAKTYGDLRPLTADLPEAGIAPARPPWPQQAPPTWMARRRPRSPLLPVVLIVLLAAVLLPGGGWVVFPLVKMFLLLWLVAAVAGLVAASRFRRRMHRRHHPGDRDRWAGRGHWY